MRGSGLYPSRIKHTLFPKFNKMNADQPRFLLRRCIVLLRVLGMLKDFGDRPYGTAGPHEIDSHIHNGTVLYSWPPMPRMASMEKVWKFGTSCVHPLHLAQPACVASCGKRLHRPLHLARTAPIPSPAPRSRQRLPISHRGPHHTTSR
jgi:hypothetical protein